VESPDSSDLVLAEWLKAPNQAGPWTIAWAGARRDTAALLQLEQRLAGAIGRLPPNAPPIAKDLIGYMTQSSRAFLTLAAAIRDKGPVAVSRAARFGVLHVLLLDALQRVQLLEARGRHQEALASLEKSGGSLLPPCRPTCCAPWWGRLRERLGRREEAATDYGYVVDAWARADSVLQPYVPVARGGLARLGTERKP
jgi:hypothetical protein